MTVDTASLNNLRNIETELRTRMLLYDSELNFNVHVKCFDLHSYYVLSESLWKGLIESSSYSRGQVYSSRYLSVFLSCNIQRRLLSTEVTLFVWEVIMCW
jgi:hypothetical protein